MAKKGNSTTYLIIAGLTAFVGVVGYILYRRRQKAKELEIISMSVPSGSSSSSSSSSGSYRSKWGIL